MLVVVILAFGRPEALPLPTAPTPTALRQTLTRKPHTEPTGLAHDTVIFPVARTVADQIEVYVALPPVAVSVMFSTFCVHALVEPAVVVGTMLPPPVPFSANVEQVTISPACTAMPEIAFGDVVVFIDEFTVAETKVSPLLPLAARGSGRVKKPIRLFRV